MALIDVLRQMMQNPNPQSPGRDAQDMINMYSQPRPQPQFSQPQAQGFAPMAPPMGTPPFVPPQQQMPQMPQQMTQPQAQGGGFREMLLHLGLPLLSTGVGLASPRMLPGAAGFNQAYSPAFQGTRQLEKENKIKERDYQEEKDYRKRKLDIEESKKNEPKTPTFGQENKIAALRTGLKRRNVTIGREFGEPSKYPINTIDDAYAAIQDAGLDPALFKDELYDLEPVKVLDKKGNVGTIPRYQLEDAIKEGYTGL